ncbi:single-stranded-DNA-specific exonuclease RecJ [Candidatus Saganbacteria bacterium]|nr:single-stranded-DNA-specific exonuclease RecJ [Candidatus Saganbacteria bacterium]
MKKWELYPQDPTHSSDLSKELKVSQVIAQIILNRGIKDPKEAQAFIAPRLSNLTDPFGLPDVKKAAERIVQAKKNGEKIAVYGDYDVDGVTGTSILYETLNHLGLNATYYIPARYGEGYSLNIDAVKKLNEDGVNIILTVDCGISSYIEIEEANSLGMAVIVTDHHKPPKKLPNSCANVNPKLSDNPQTRELSGAGVAFKFAWALLRAFGIAENSFLTSLLDLASLGTIADVVPLNAENRILAKQGLGILNGRKRPGIKALCDVAGLKNDLTIRDINFGLAPRINAAGRLDHASLSVNLLISKDPTTAKKYAEELNKVNIRRQGVGDQMGKEVFEKIERLNLASEKIIIVSGENWHAGVIGIIASRVVDKFNKPAILIGINEGEGRGSARSIENFNIFKVLESCRDLFSDFGGHEAAAGFEIAPDKIEEFKRRIIEVTADLDMNFTSKVKVDSNLNPEQLTLNLAREIKLLDPFGQGNPVPIFASYDLKPVDIKLVGNTGSHIKIKFTNGSQTFEAIGFGMGEFKEMLKPTLSYDIAYSLATNLWNGFETVQLNLVDIKPSAT